MPIFATVALMFATVATLALIKDWQTRSGARRTRRTRLTAFAQPDGLPSAGLVAA